MSLRSIIRTAINKLFYPNCYSSKVFVNYLQRRGVSVGKNTVFFDPKSILIDVTRPYLIEIGEYCKITRGVIILSHDYSRSVLRVKYGEVLGEARKVKIGNNVFIGMNSIILMGTTVGNNVIIGAGSVVTKDIPDNMVVAGNPAKVIMTLDEYYKRRKSAYVEEAKEYAKNIYRQTNEKPDIKLFDGFYPIFLERDLQLVRKYNFRTNLSGDSEDEVINWFLNSEPIYNSFEEFLSDAKIDSID